MSFSIVSKPFALALSRRRAPPQPSFTTESVSVAVVEPGVQHIISYRDSVTYMYFPFTFSMRRDAGEPESWPYTYSQSNGWGSCRGPWLTSNFSPTLHFHEQVFRHIRGALCGIDEYQYITTLSQVSSATNLCLPHCFGSNTFMYLLRHPSDRWMIMDHGFSQNLTQIAFSGSFLV